MVIILNKLFLSELEAYYLVLIVDAESTNIYRLILINLHHLGGATKIKNELDVTDELREGLNLVLFVRIDIFFELIELFPGLFVYLQVHSLLAADLIKFCDFLLVHAAFNIQQYPLLLKFVLFMLRALFRRTSCSRIFKAGSALVLNAREEFLCRFFVYDRCVSQSFMVRGCFVVA